MRRGVPLDGIARVPRNEPLVNLPRCDKNKGRCDYRRPPEDAPSLFTEPLLRVFVLSFMSCHVPARQKHRDTDDAGEQQPVPPEELSPSRREAAGTHGPCLFTPSPYSPRAISATIAPAASAGAFAAMMGRPAKIGRAS